MSRRLAKKLLIIGWDGADWQILKPLLEQGRMPVLQQLVSEGVMGNFASMDPMISPMLWTTMATGKPPYDHGICGFIEPDREARDGIRMASSRSRRCPAFWNILSDQGIHTNVVGWYVSHPAEAINGVCVSELFSKPVGPLNADWPVAAGSVQPAQLAGEIADLRVHPHEIAREQIEYFIPDLASVPTDQHLLVGRLATNLAECATNQAVTTWIMETQPWEVVAVYFSALDHICHAFMYFHPPQMAHVPDEMFSRYSEVVNRACQFHDLMLSRLLKLAGDDATVIIVSDHGYQTGDRRPILTPTEIAGPAIWHRRFGMLAMKGPGIRRDELVFGARLLDLAPTILALMGVAPGSDMPGNVLTQAFIEPHPVDRIDSWKQAEPAKPGSEQLADPFAEQAAFQQLVELGYIEPLAANRQDAIDRAALEYEYNLGRALMTGRRLEEAVGHLELVHVRQPDRLNVALQLVDCYHRLGRFDDCRRLIDFLEQGTCFEKSLESDEARQLPQIDLMRGVLELSLGNLDEAHACLTRAEGTVGRMPGFHVNLGELYVRMDRRDDAARALAIALEIDPDDARALTGMAAIHLQEGRDELAASCALHSLEVLYQQPRAHFLLAMALKRQGDLPRAREALEVSLRMNPADQEADRQLRLIAERAPRFSN
jgi:predicted AlkP superfamily phosphohydrolase/phosphomutase/tetratricopeptide (TPR) repeat protein